MAVASSSSPTQKSGELMSYDQRSWLKNMQKADESLQTQLPLVSVMFHRPSPAQRCTHTSYLKDYQSLKNLIRIKLKETDHPVLLHALCSKFIELTQRHQTLKTLLPNFPYARYPDLLESLQEKCEKNEKAFLTKHQDCLAKKKVLSYSYLESYSAVKRAFKTYLISLPPADERRHLYEQKWKELCRLKEESSFQREIEELKQISKISSYRLMAQYASNLRVDCPKMGFLDDLKTYVHKIEAHVLTTGERVRCWFLLDDREHVLNKKMGVIEKLIHSQHVVFNLESYNQSGQRKFRLVAQLKLQERKLLSSGREIAFYTDGSADDLTPWDGKLKGTVKLASGLEKVGVFDPLFKALSQGYQVHPDRYVELMNPPILFEWRISPELWLRVIEFNDRFSVIERRFNRGRARDSLSDRTFQKVFFSACKRKNGNISIAPILGHPFFRGYRNQLIEVSSRGRCKLLHLSERAFLDVLDHFDLSSLNPLEIKSRKSKRNLFEQVAYYAEQENQGFILLKRLINLFPDHFESARDRIVAVLSKNLSENPSHFGFIQEVIALSRSEKTPYLQAWIDIAAGRIPQVDFQDFSEREQQVLEQVAYVVGNPYVHCSPSEPVKPSGYSLNFICMEQEVLQQEFVERLAGWIKMNPGALIRVVIDGKEVSKELIEQRLEQLEEQGVDSDIVEFVDLTQLPVYRVFHELNTMPIPRDYRKEIAKTIFANAVFELNEEGFLVYATVSHPPLSSREIFDRQTVAGLKISGFIMPGREGVFEFYDPSFLILNLQHKPFMDSYFYVCGFQNVEMGSWEKPLVFLFQATIVHLFLASEPDVLLDFPIPDDRALVGLGATAEERRRNFLTQSPMTKFNRILKHQVELMPQVKIQKGGKQFSLQQILETHVPKKPIRGVALSSSVASSSS